MIALYLGAGDHKKAETAATHGMALSLMHGILITIVSIVIMPGFCAGSPATQADRIRHHLLHHRIPVCHHQHGGTGL